MAKTISERLDGFVAALGLDSDNPSDVARAIETSPVARKLYDKIQREEGGADVSQDHTQESGEQL